MKTAGARSLCRNVTNSARILSAKRFGMEGNMEKVDDVIRMLDNMAESGVSRIKVEISEEVTDGAFKKAYHHGRCDVGSPFATGKLFDAKESEY